MSFYRIIFPTGSSDFQYTINQFYSGAAISSGFAYQTGQQIFYSNYLGLSGATDYQINITSYDPNFGNFTYSSSNLNVATVNSNGLVIFNSSGDSNIGISNGLQIKVSALNFTASGFSGQSSPYFYQFTGNSLGYVTSTGINSRILGLNPSTGTMYLFSNLNNASGQYVRNTGCWAYSYDTTPICAEPHQRGGTLVTPRHIVYANHFQIPSGSTLIFTDFNNISYSRVLKGTYGMTGADLSHDLMIGALDSDLPPSISFCKVLSNNFSGLCTPNFDYIPILQSDQEKKALIKNLNGSDHNFQQSPIPSQSGFYEDGVNGDSGSPSIMFISGQPILLTVDTFGGGGDGTSILQNKFQLNWMIRQADLAANHNISNYSLQEINLSGLNI